jgi:hypothetical protein
VQTKEQSNKKRVEMTFSQFDLRLEHPKFSYEGTPPFKALAYNPNITFQGFIPIERICGVVLLCHKFILLALVLALESPPQMT